MFFRKKVKVEKNSNDNNWIKEFDTTNPKPEPEYENTANLLKDLIKREEIFNIGIVAPYGAGKSSAIKTWEKDLPRKDKKRICQISVANFDSMQKSKRSKKKVNKYEEDKTFILGQEKNDNKEKNVQEETYDEKNVEKSVLQQIIYKNNSFKVHDSVFSKIDGFLRLHFFGGIIVSLILFLSLFICFQFFKNPFYIKNFEVRRKVCIILAAVDFVLVTFMSYWIIKKHLLKKIKISSFEFETNENNKISIFNQYIDEIIYRFNKLKYNVVVIEDLDRFDNYSIFVKLRELCSLINFNNRIKWKVTFVYAVKDSMFDSIEERSKFFDAIVPIIPNLTTNNNYDKILNDIKNKFGKYELKSSMVSALIPYIDNKRVQINIFNDFLIYTNELKGFSDYNQLFAMMVLKNVNPSEFELLQNHSSKSKIIKIFETEKLKIASEIVLTNEKEIKKIEADINDFKDEIKNGSYEDMKFLKSALFGEMCKFIGPEYSSVRMDDSFDTFENLSTIKYTAIQYGVRRQLECSLRDIEQRIGEIDFFLKKEKKYRELITKKISLLEEHLSILKNENAEVFNKTLEEISEIKNEYLVNIIDDDFLLLVLSNGYINENYKACLSNDSNSFLTKEDLDTIKMINSKRQIDFERVVFFPSAVINQLDPLRFASQYGFNFYLAKYIFENSDNYLTNYKKKLNYFISGNREKVVEIVYESEIDINQKNSFFKTLMLQDISIWNEIWMRFSDNFDDQFLTELLSGFERYFPSMNDKGNITKFLNESELYDFNLISIRLIKQLKSDVKAKYKNIKTIKDKEILRYVSDEGMFFLSYDNVCFILKELFGFDEKEILEKNYDIILSTKNDKFINYVTTPIDEYIGRTYSKEGICSLKSETVTELMNNADISLDNKKIIASKESNAPFYEKNYSTDLLNFLLENNKLRIKEIKDYEFLVSQGDIKLVKQFLLDTDAFSNIAEQINTDDLKGFRHFVLTEFDSENCFKSIADSSISVLQVENNLQGCKILLNKNKISYSADDLRKIKNFEIKKEFIKRFKNDIALDIDNGIYNFETDALTFIESKVFSKTVISQLLNKIDSTKFAALIESIKDNLPLLTYVDALTFDIYKKEILSKFISKENNGNGQ